MTCSRCRLLAAALLALLLAPAPASAARRLGPHVDNPWFPLTPGTTLVYRGVKDGKPARDVFAITHRIRRVNGVRCVVVHDRLYLRGRLAERTTDYYAQDRRGDVWYFGEDTAELDAHGRVTSREGTWRAGADGAHAGLFMPAHPRVGERHRQERFRGHAEDRFEVVSVDARVRVPYGAFAHALRTREWTPLEPGVLDGKAYVRGIGEIQERTIHGPLERLALVRVAHR